MERFIYGPYGPTSSVRNSIHVPCGPYTSGNIFIFGSYFCNFLGLPKGHAVAVSSGSSALFLAIKILSSDKKTVTIPGYVCTALRNAIELNQLDFVFVDVKKNTPKIDSVLIKSNSNP